jgi:aspartate racemase
MGTAAPDDAFRAQPESSVEERSPLIGVLGGMGPAATVDFLDKLVRSTPATRDQEHLRVVVWSDPTVPDRSAALLDGGPDPTPALERGVRELVGLGVELLVVPCNTAHWFVRSIVVRTGAQLLDMVEETADRISGMEPIIDLVGVMATTGTVHTGLYQDSLRRRGMASVLPDAAEQTRLMRAIHAVKAGDVGGGVRAELASVARALTGRGAQVIVAGCTEIPLALSEDDAGVVLVDPSQVLVDSLLAQTRAGGAPVPGI